MITFIHKEIRLVRTAWIVALLLAVVPVWCQDVPRAAGARAWEMPWWILWFGAGTLCLGIAPFGQEFNCRTFNLLLVQPQPRRRLFYLKTATAAVAMLSVWLALYLSCQFRFAGAASTQGLELWLWRAALVALLAFCGGLWTTMVFRQITASLMVTVLAPFVLVSAAFLTSLAYASFHSRGNDAPPDVPADVLWWMMLAYSAAGLWWARWQFLRAQDLQWSGWVGSVPMLIGRWIVGRRRLRPGESLILKELQLQQISVLLSLGMACMWLVAELLSVPTPPHAKTPPFQTFLMGWKGFCLFILFFIPLLMGAAAVAEERSLGVMESLWHIPVGRLRQFITKLGVVLVLTFLLGVLMPCALDAVSAARGTARIFGAGSEPFEWLPLLAVLGVVAGGVAALSFYASTLSRNSLQAAVLTLFLVGVVSLLSAAALRLLRDVYFVVGPLLATVGGVIALMVLLCLSYSNYKGLQIAKSAVLFNAAVWLAALLIMPFVALGIFFTPWEWAMSLEPPHGAPRLNLSGRAAILDDNAGLFALLPDGRLWAAQDVRVLQTNTVWNGTGYESGWLVVPEKGTYIGGSNWMEMARRYHSLFGLKSDGTLWTISCPSLPDGVSTWMSAKPSGRGRSVHLTFEIKRIGNDSDWAALSCAYNYCLALRGDGSLWGWGANGEILGKGPENPAAALAHFVWRGSYLTPKRIGNDSDWAAISAEGISAMAIKRDGSVWKWGLLQHPPEKPVNKHNPTLQYHAAPVRWTSAGTNWVILDGRDDRRMLALHNDGAMYAFAGLVGEPTLDWIGSDTEWQRVENGAAPSEFKMRGGQLVVQLSAALRYNLSKYSDWVTPGVLSYWHGGSVWRRDAGTTLAADGTLSHWKLDLGMLGPSRHPAWSINILDEKP